MEFTYKIEINDKEHVIPEIREWFDNVFSQKKGFFSICTIDKALEMMNIEKQFSDTRVYHYMNSLHCKHYSEMKSGTLEKVKEMCYKLLGDDPTINRQFAELEECEFVQSE